MWMSEFDSDMWMSEFDSDMWMSEFDSDMWMSEFFMCGLRSRTVLGIQKFSICGLPFLCCLSSRVVLLMTACLLWLFGSMPLRYFPGLVTAVVQNSFFFNRFFFKKLGTKLSILCIFQIKLFYQP